MGHNEKKEELIREEQAILNETLAALDGEKKEKDVWIKRFSEIAKKARKVGLPEAYGTLTDARSREDELKEQIQDIRKSEDSLYDARIIVNIKDSDGDDDEELKIGKHPCTVNGEMIITDWKLPICRYFLLDNASPEREITDKDKYGDSHTIHYTLKLRRDIKTRFATVKDVIVKYPLDSEEAKEMLYDEFLKSLVERRNETGFRDIIFSIQKKQGEIIQRPYEENIIVQGCAGSGKSMIMLHRLPVLMFDNKEKLPRNSIFIISPSKAYIQMAEKMRGDLEIEDIDMGTIEDYFNLCIERYKHDPKEYGELSLPMPITEKSEQYIYSDKCLEDIRKQIESYIGDTNDETIKIGNTIGLTIDQIHETDNYVDRVGWTSTNMHKLLDYNDEQLRTIFDELKETLDKIGRLAVVIKERKNSILSAINKRISTLEGLKAKATEEAEKESSKGNDNRFAELNSYIIKYNTASEILKGKVEEINLDEKYFEGLDKAAASLEKITKTFSGMNELFERNQLKDVYKYIGKLDSLYGKYFEHLSIITHLEDKYVDYAGDSVRPLRRIAGDEIVRMANEVRKDRKFLPYKTVERIQERLGELSDYEHLIPKSVFDEIMVKAGIGSKTRKLIKVPACAPYLFLQILYQFHGKVQVKHDTLIAIDEAQSVSKSEFALIKAQNPNVVLNIFGDVRQHIEGRKGLESWNDLDFLGNFKIYEMNENYRNAKEITEYSNRAFSMNMRAINMNGMPVAKPQNEKEYTELIKMKLQESGGGLRAIIVKTVKEAENFINKFALYKDHINNLIENDGDFHRTRWNLMTVSQVKGLEFTHVIAVIGSMSPNMKYITCTRALEELIVYDDHPDIRGQENIGADEIDLIKDVHTDDKSSDCIDSEIGKVHESKQHKVTKIKDGSLSVIKAFFEKNNLNVVLDDTKDELWVVGSKKDIGKYVEEAEKKFAVTGTYSISKNTGFKPGWRLNNDKGQ